MSALEQDVEYGDIYWWKPPLNFTWEEFHEALSEIQDLGKAQSSPFTIIALPEGDLPTGNAIPHLKRLFGILRDSQQIHRFMVVLDSKHPISNFLMKIVPKIYGLPSRFFILKSVEEALALCQSLA